MPTQDELDRFIYHKNGWSAPEKPPPKKSPNVRGEKIGKLWLDGKVVKTGAFTLLQTWKKKYCSTYGITKENAKKRFNLTY